MVIACSKCQIRFHVDDTRIPASGVKVRCSRCKHAFFVRTPDAAADAALDASALEPSVPEPSLDLAGSTEPPESLAGGGEDGGVDEDEWQFAIDPPDAAISRSPDREPPPEQEAEAQPAPAEESLADRAKELRAAAKLADTEHSSLADLASPESWDLVAGNDGALAPESPAAAASDPASSVAPGPAPGISAGLEPEPAPESFAQDAGPEADFEAFGDEDWAETEVSETDEEFDEPAVGAGRSLEPRPAAAASAAPMQRRASASSEAFGVAARGTGWVALGALFFAMGIGWVRQVPVASTGPSVVSVAGLEVRGVRARFVENASVGPLIVVTGSLVNAAAEAVVPDGAIQVALLDARQQPLAATALAGSPVEEAWLRGEDPERIAQEFEASAARLARRSFVPGQVVPFQAVLRDSLAGTSLRLESVVAPALPRPGLQAPPTGAELDEAVASDSIETDGDPAASGLPAESGL